MVPLVLTPLSGLSLSEARQLDYLTRVLVIAQNSGLSPKKCGEEAPWWRTVTEPDFRARSGTGKNKVALNKVALIHRNAQGDIHCTGKNSPGIMNGLDNNCLLYTSPSPRDATLSRMPSSA